MRSIEDYSLTVALLKQVCAPRVACHRDSEDLAAILRDNPQLVVAMNHGPPAGPLAATIALMDQYSKHGGAERKPVVIAWRGLYQVPLVRQATRFISQVRRPPDFSGFLKKLTHEGFTDVFVMPEGENAVFGNGRDIEPFLSPRFVELAVRAQAPILIAVHAGSEHWSNFVDWPPALDFLLRSLPTRLYHRIRAQRRLNLPPWRIRRLPAIGVRFRLYQPSVTLTDLQGDNARAALQHDADQVRALMQNMMDSLP